MQRFGSQTRYRLGISSIFVILYWWFVLRNEKIENGKKMEKDIIENIPGFDEKKRLQKRKKLYQDIEHHETEHNMKAFYQLFLEKITETYGDQYLHMTLEEIQKNKGLSESIIKILSGLYAPIYDQKEKNTEEQKQIAEAIK